MIKMPIVLFIVNKNRATSIPLELANHIDKTRFDLRSAVFYQNVPDSALAVTVPLTDIGAQGKLDLRAIFALFRVIKATRPDIIHVHHTLSGALASVFGKILNTPVLINTEHHDHRDLSILQKCLNLPTLLLSDATICNSTDTCRSFSRWEKTFLRNKQMVIHNGVDIAWLENCAHDSNRIRKAYGLGPDDFIIGNVGRLVPPKDQESLIRGMSIVTKSLKNAKLIIVGTGPLRTRLENLVRKLGLKENVVFASSLQREAVYQLLHTIDLFVMYSLWEGFCNALVEAMAAGKPIVASDIETFREIMGESGYFVQSHNPAALASAILNIANMPIEERQAIGETLRQCALANYSLKHTARAYEQVYESGCSKRGPRTKESDRWEDLTVDGFCRKRVRSMLVEFCGSTGSGKSILAAETVNQLSDLGAQAVMADDVILETLRFDRLTNGFVRRAAVNFLAALEFLRNGKPYYALAAFSAKVLWRETDSYFSLVPSLPERDQASGCSLCDQTQTD